MLKYIYIMAGVLLLSLGINIFYGPQQLVTGGATGIGIILSGYIPIWLTNLIINVPLLAVAAKVKGKEFIRRTIFATLFLSFSLYVTAFIPVDYLQTDLLLAAVFGGALSGIGLGVVFRYSSTTGGSDLAASIIHHYIKHISVSKIMFAIDSTIIFAGFFIFGAERAMYAIIAVFICTKVIDTVLEGLSFAKAAFIISERSTEISGKLMTGLERGATSLYGRGMYTGRDKDVLLCVVSSKEVVRLKELVAECDDKAFVIVADVREVLGEGFGTLND